MALNSTQLIAIGVVAVLVVAGAAFILVNHNDDDDGGWDGKTVIDAIGNEVSLKEAPNRIASTTVTATEYICQLGYRNALVGATVNAGVYDVDNEVIGIDMDLDYPKTIKEDLESGKIIGVGKTTNWSVESVAATNPDLVLVGQDSAEKNPAYLDQFKSLDIVVYVISNGSTWDEIFTNYRNLGKLLSAEDRANKIIEDIDKADDLLMDAVSGMGTGLKVAKICYCYGKYYVYDTTPILETMLSTGATNAIPVEVGYTVITPENIAQADPDIIIFDDMSTGLDWADVIADWKADPVMGNIDCIKNDSFYCFEAGAFRSTNYNTAHYLEGEALVLTLMFNEQLDVDAPNILTDGNWKSYLAWFEELVE